MLGRTLRLQRSLCRLTRSFSSVPPPKGGNSNSGTAPPRAASSSNAQSRGIGQAATAPPSSPPPRGNPPPPPPSGSSASNFKKVPPVLSGWSGKHAQGLFAAARENNAVERTGADLEQFIQSYYESDDIRLFFENPLRNEELKLKFLEKLTANFHDVTKEYILLIYDEKKLDQVEKILLDYKDLVKYENNEVHAVITSAQELNETQTNRIVSALEKRLQRGQNLIIQTKIDPSIMGGLFITMDDSFLDLSARYLVSNMEDRVLEYSI